MITVDEVHEIIGASAGTGDGRDSDGGGDGDGLWSEDDGEDQYDDDDDAPCDDSSSRQMHKGSGGYGGGGGRFVFAVVGMVWISHPTSGSVSAAGATICSYTSLSNLGQIWSNIFILR